MFAALSDQRTLSSYRDDASAAFGLAHAPIITWRIAPTIARYIASSNTRRTDTSRSR